MIKHELDDLEVKINELLERFHKALGENGALRKELNNLNAKYTALDIKKNQAMEVLKQIIQQLQDELLQSGK
jgi:chemotaxis protein histidine kinase CheA